MKTAFCDQSSLSGWSYQHLWGTLLFCCPAAFYWLNESMTLVRLHFLLFSLKTQQAPPPNLGDGSVWFHILSLKSHKSLLRWTFCSLFGVNMLSYFNGITAKVHSNTPFWHVVLHVLCLWCKWAFALFALLVLLDTWIFLGIFCHAWMCLHSECGNQ